MSIQASARCSDLSRDAREPYAATASTTERWLVVEVSGAWPNDVGTEGVLPPRAHAAVSAWVAASPESRLLFVRRPGRPTAEPFALTALPWDGRLVLRRLPIARHEDLATLDLDRDGEHFEGPLVLVCGHGSRDRCCAQRGTPVFTALASTLDEEHLWISSHQGGHRFAANVVVLPAGVQLGRLDPDTAPAAVAAALEGRVDLAHYRGRTFHEPAVQAAEHAVREATGLDALDDLSLLGVDGSNVRFATRDGRELTAEVEEGMGPTLPASCGASPEPQRVLRARVVAATTR